MCTVTFLPTENCAFVLTSNRDEKLVRPSAFLPNFIKINDLQILCPIDAQAKGTWIATAPTRTVCLLNGAFVPHIPKEKYRQSRGKVVLDSFLFPTLNTFLKEYDLADIEPFTLVMVNHNPFTLTELIWDGNQKTITERNPLETAIWSSVTLYSPDIVLQRQQWFAAFLESHQNGKRQEQIIDFHRFGGKDDKTNSILMNRNNEFLTVSITSVSIDADMRKMRYFDLINTQEKEIMF
jgi:hypothetical protein